jgi:hypothetical protein
LKHGIAKTARYRLGQFVRALLTAHVPEEEVEQAVRVLTPQAQELFHRQAVQDQRHALAVYQALRRAGHANPQLLAAALLHDVGKAAARLPAWQRAIIVLLERFAPHLLACLGQGEPQGPMRRLPSGWRRPFIINAQHPETGARWAQEAGCLPLTVALIRRHQNRPSGGSSLVSLNEKGDASEEDRLLEALQAADSLN